MADRKHAPIKVFEGLIEALLRLSQLMVENPDIKEVDVNPLRVLHEGEVCRALDARIILG